MGIKEQKSREYANWLHKNLEEQLGHKCAPHDMYYRRGDIQQAFEVGWDEALKNQWINVKEKQPNPNELVLCRMVSNEAIVSGFVFSEGCKWRVSTLPDFEFEDYGGYECDYWMPIPSFDEIIELNKDVLKRLKCE